MAREILAGSAIEMLLPLVDRADKDAAGEDSERAERNGRQVLAWLREKLDERGRQSLGRFEADPDSRAWRRDLTTRIARLFERDPASAGALEAMIVAGLGTAQQVMQERRRRPQGDSGQFGRNGQQGRPGGSGEWQEDQMRSDTGISYGNISPNEGEEFGSDPTGYGSGGGRDD